MSRQDHFYHGEFFGLPAKVKHVPFAKESPCKDATGLTAAELAVVVAVIAAEFCQIGPVSLKEIDTIVECSAHSKLRGLVAMGWLEKAGQVKGRTSKLYAPTTKAKRELGLQGWSLLKEVA